MAYAIFRTAKLKNFRSVENTLCHIMLLGKKYEDLRRELPPDQRPINIMTEPQRKGYKGVKGYKRCVYDNINNYHIRKNAVLAIQGVMTYSPEASEYIDDKEFAQQCYNFLCDTYGRDNVYLCQLHRHEKTEHIHFVVMPIVENRLNARALQGGNKYVMRELQDKFFAYVKSLGLERGIHKELTEARHITQREYKKQEIKKAAETATKAEYFDTVIQPNMSEAEQAQFNQSIKNKERKIYAAISDELEADMQRISKEIEATER